jgi:hypothetical protein
MVGIAGPDPVGALSQGNKARVGIGCVTHDSALVILRAAEYSGVGQLGEGTVGGDSRDAIPSGGRYCSEYRVCGQVRENLRGDRVPTG